MQGKLEGRLQITLKMLIIIHMLHTPPVEFKSKNKSAVMTCGNDFVEGNWKGGGGSA